ncbi:Small subunit processome component 20 [Amphibalanus amphitrite]|uniref:Small subunit processome component 20 n=1 Tax=Amphibalanus amphitrite TaxID=1232801 RepID=A0A6A4VZP9_AMPAM|nr:Small subunit processome component 20 [Amphibalanus amphitrite]
MGAGDKKLENRYKFKTFSERIAEISVNVAQNVSLPRNETPEDADTFFFEELQKWVDLNLTEHYADFQNELGPDVQSFAQLLHRKDEIIELLKKHLSVENSLALQPLLALLSALARDLRADLGPQFPALFELLCRLLDTRDPERLQWLFTCLAHLYKQLWRHLVANIEQTYRMYRQLLSGGRPDHVVRFAAESFAFVCRKVKDKSKFFGFVYTKLKSDPSQATGVGRLVFETLRGVRGHLHTEAAAVLRVQLELLGSERLPAELVQQALNVALLAAARHVTRENAAPIWTELWAAVERCPSDRPDLLRRLLSLLLSVTTFRGGAVITDAADCARRCGRLLAASALPEEAGAAAADLAAKLLSVENARLATADAVKLVNQALRGPQPPGTLLRLCGHLLGLAELEGRLLPELLALLHRLPADSASDALRLLSRLVLLRRPPPETGESWADWRQYPIDFNFIRQKQAAPRRSARRRTVGSDDPPESPQSSVCALVERLLRPADDSGPPAPSADLTAALLVAPHLRPPPEDAAAAVWALWHRLADQLREMEAEHLTDDRPDPVSSVRLVVPPLPPSLHARLALLSQLTETALRLDAGDAAAAWRSALKLAGSRRLASSAHVLRMLDLLLTAAEPELRTDQLLLELYQTLGHNLASPHHKLRALTLHLLSLFDPTLPPPPADGPPRTARSVFTTCWMAEQQPADIQSYKERLKFLQLLDAEYIVSSLPVCGDFSAAPLLYLLGTLHVPFRLLWKPCQELAAAHCHRLSTERLAELWGHLTKEAAEAARKQMMPEMEGEEEEGGSEKEATGEADENEEETEEMETEQSDAAEAEREELEELDERLAALDDRLDFVNFRLLLWQMSADLCSLLEPICGPQLISELFSFLDREFFSSDMSFAREQDLLDRRRPAQEGHSRKQKGDTSGDDGGDEEGEEDEEEEEERPRKKKGGDKKKGIVQALCAHLTVMSKMTSLRRSEKSTQLFETFLHFLTHKRSDVQKVALECVYAYKAKGLNPYRETLFSLMEDNNFKTTLTSFSIDTESGILKPEHRPHVLPVLTRILYGRMRTSTGKGAASRDNAAARRRVIVGFLAGCRSEEVDQFLDLTLAALAARVRPDPVQMVREVTEAADPRHALPLRQLQSALLLLTAVFFKLGSRLQPSVPRLLRLLLGAAAHVSALLAQQQRLPVWHVRTLKKIRGMILACLSDMFERFDTYPWSAEETEAVFIASVWPSLPKLTQESTTAPTGLLKLFLVWASTPRYFPLLVKETAEPPRLSPLWCMLSLLTVRGCHSSVTAAVVRAAEQLLSERTPPPTLSTIDEDGEPSEEPLPPLTVTGLPEWATEADDVTGPAAVAENVTPLLEYLRNRLQSGGAARLSTTELTVLSSVCRLEAGPAREHAASLASLLLPVLGSARPPPEGRQRQLLVTLRHLLSAADRPVQFVRSLSALLSHLPNRESHLAVVGCLRTIGERDPAVRPLAETVDALSAMDPKQVDEPDFDRRLVEYGRVNERLRHAELLEEDFLRLVVHCCLWSLEHEADLALRDSSTFCLQEVARSVGRLLTTHRSAAVAFLSACLLPALRRRLRSKEDQLRHDTVAVLQVVVQSSADHMPKLAELAQLSNATDSEHDFFENIRHIQVHRRTRALKRVVEGLTDGSLRMRADVVTNYILPLGNVYLFNEKYAKYTGLTDTAVRLIGIVSGRMSWHQYQAFLRHFLALLPTCSRQRDAVKVLVAVLDAFPFDLSSVAPDVTMSIISATRADERGWKTRRQEAAVPEVNGPPTEQPARVEKEEAEDSEPAEGETALGQEAAAEPLEPAAVEVPEEEGAPVAAGPVAQSSKQAELICRTLIRTTLPGLHAGLVRRARGDEQHATNKTLDPDEERSQRLPLALAMIKLLQKLPEGILGANVASVLTRVCELLRSKTPSVREAARETLLRCLRALGPAHLPLALSELRAVSGRGYQQHVMVFTTHALLRGMCEQLKAGDLDPCASDVVDICHMELFGQTAEEKEVQKITSKTAEAKGVKSYKMLHILAQYITEPYLHALIAPLQEWALSSRTAKAAGKVAECLRHACSGLVENAGLETPALLVLGHGLVSQSLPVPDSVKKDGSGKKGKTKPLPYWLQRPDMLLIQKPPPRHGAPARLNSTVNAHLLVDFGLQLLSALLRKGRVVATESRHVSMLDPFVPLLVGCLSEPSVPLVTVCLRCWTHLLTFPLPSLPGQLAAVSGALFTLLHKYAAPGLASGENGDMVAVTFRAVTVLVRDVTAYTLTEEQLRVLLTYAEQDLLDAGRRGTAFQLLRAVFSRKLHAPELAEVVRHLAKLVVTADGDQPRAQARSVLMQYLLDYPLGDKVKKHVMFFLQQLGYDRESGRLAALDMIADVCRQFPQGLLSSQAPLLFVYLSARLVSEPSPTGRRRVASTITALLQRVSAERRRHLLDMTLTWLRGEDAAKKVEQGRMAAQLVGLFLSDAADVTDSEVDLMLPELCGRMDPELNDFFGSAPQAELNGSPEQHTDHLLYQLLGSLLKLLTLCPQAMTASHRHAALMTRAWGHIKQYLLHPHAWVRLAAGRLYGLLLSRLEPASVAACLTSPGASPAREAAVPPYLHSDTGRRLRGLALDLCVQLSSELLSQQLADQCVKNLVWIAKVLICAGALDPGSDHPEPSPAGVKRPRRDSDSAAPGRKRTESGSPRKRTDSESSVGRKRTDSESSTGRKRRDSESKSGRKRTDSESSVGRKRSDSESRSGRKRTESESSVTESESTLSLRWLTRRLRREVNAEVVKSPRITLRRCSVFKWMAAVAMSLDSQLAPFLHLLLPPLVREITDPSAPLELKTLATEVTDLMKRSVGVETFTAAYTRAQLVLSQRKAERRIQRKQQLVTNPVKTARMKMQKHIKKRAAKKRKIMQDKQVGFKRRKVSNMG